MGRESGAFARLPAISEADDNFSPRTSPVAIPERFYRPELDVLRFFAFFAVFLFHLPENEFYDRTSAWGLHRIVAGALSAGSFGVDLFFVLSAYLITSLLLRERGTTGTVDVRKFYLRRILRIWPLYFGFLALALLLTRIFPEYRMAPAYWFSFLFLLGNFSIGGTGVNNHVIGPLWSISVEEQFYLIWPNIVRNASREWITRCAVWMLLISFFARLTAPFTGLYAIWTNTFTRLDPIALGILIAVRLHPRVPQLRRATRKALLLASGCLWMIAGTVCGIHFPSSPLQLVIGYPLVAIGSGGILLAILGIRAAEESRVWAAMLYLGQISYGLYMFHGMTLTLIRRVIGPENLLGWAVFAVLALAATIALAVPSYEYYEKPFLRIKRRLAHVPSRSI